MLVLKNLVLKILVLKNSAPYKMWATIFLSNNIYGIYAKINITPIWAFDLF